MPLETRFSEKQLREVALACFTNAQEFYEEACLLLKQPYAIDCSGHPWY